jgi:uncharacterized DUF497 family protein
MKTGDDMTDRATRSAMKSFTIWFHGNRSSTEMRIEAYTAAQARAIFAAYHNVAVSRYIAAVSTRRATKQAAG